MWTSLEHVRDVESCDFGNILSLKLGGLNHPTFMKDMCSLIGSQPTIVKIETFHFDVDIGLIGKQCPNIEDLHVINARIKVTKNSDDQGQTFSRLKLLYLFLVQYLIEPIHIQRPPISPSSPAGVPHPSTGHTALHTLLMNGTNLESVQVSGSSALTDSCIDSIFTRNSLSKLKRLVISHQTSIDNLVVPLTSHSVVRIQKSCPENQCLGDLKHWAVTPAQRRNFSRNIHPYVI